MDMPDSILAPICTGSPARTSRAHIPRCASIRDSGDLVIPAHSNRPRILWIDDQIHAADAGVRLLECTGFQVGCATTGGRGVAMATGGTYDAILLDLRLPDDSGLDVLRKLHDCGVAAPVIMLTGHADIESAVTAIKLGAADFWCKPLYGDEAATLLRNIIAQRPHATFSGAGCLPSDTDFVLLHALCDELASGVTVQAQLQPILRILSDAGTSLRCFLGCALALRLVLATGDAQLVVVASAVRGAIVDGALQYRGPSSPKVCEAIRRLRASGIDQSLQALAAPLGIHPTHLGRLIHLETGLFFREWRRLIAMKDAVPQILGTSEQIAPIAYGVAHQPSQFDREFRQMFGTTPSGLRRLSALVHRARGHS